MIFADGTNERNDYSNSDKKEMIENCMHKKRDYVHIATK